MKLDKETENAVQEMQLIEQNLQNFALQKQAFQMELNETESASEELKKSKGDVYKIVGQIMVRSHKEQLEKELEEKNKLLGLRLKAIEKQELMLSEKLERLRNEVLGKIK